MSESKYDKIWKVLSNYTLEICEGISESIRCIICQKIMIDPYTGSCGCHYCGFCIKEYVKEERKYCPGKGEECSEEYLDMNSNVVKDFSSRRSILNTMVKCPNESCHFESKLENIEDHIRLCKGSLMECPYKMIGCEKERAREESSVNDHLYSDMAVHSELIVEAINHFKNETNRLRHIIDEKECEINNLKEEVRVNKKDIEERKEDGRRNEILVQNTREQAQRLEAKIEENERNMDWNEKEEKLQKTLESIKINIKSMIKKDDLGVLIQKYDKEMSEMKENIDLVMRRQKELILNSKYDVVWRITKFLERFGENAYLYSNPFYKDGYKLCLGVIIYGYGNYFDINVHVMKGTKDDEAQWPMASLITVYLLNQENLRVHQSFICESDESGKRIEYLKPKSDMNREIICGRICLAEIREKPEVVSNNSILLSC